MEINFVHYQGSIAQRALAMFLLCNAPVVDEVWWKVTVYPDEADGGGQGLGDEQVCQHDVLLAFACKAQSISSESQSISSLTQIIEKIIKIYDIK